MSKTKVKKKRKVHLPESTSHEDRVYRVLSNLKHKDLQRECILRGIEFEHVVKLDHHKLVGWFFKNFDNTQDPNLLNQFDAWRDETLRKEGYLRGDEQVAPALRFALPGEIESMGRIQEPGKKEKVEKPKKPKAEVDEKTGVRKGTKKAMTYALALEGKDIKEAVKLVKEAFPEAEEKSIKIWYKRALKPKSE